MLFGLMVNFFLIKQVSKSRKQSSCKYDRFSIKWLSVLIPVANHTKVMQLCCNDCWDFCVFFILLWDHFSYLILTSNSFQRYHFANPISLLIFSNPLTFPKSILSPARLTLIWFHIVCSHLIWLIDFSPFSQKIKSNIRRLST